MTGLALKLSSRHHVTGTQIQAGAVGGATPEERGSHSQARSSQTSGLPTTCQSSFKEASSVHAN